MNKGTAQGKPLHLRSPKTKDTENPLKNNKIRAKSAAR